ncbi:DUF1285 domain-containing protein [Microbulbifer yueqingensis]|uniref:DUF1285 domain-containing protein n=1 Tax=Microbulbifer yueqingensis TaxID=658219 RepID=A0A1G8ZZM8_9GAMM|nr:DUF1285 domain-containing protein [Microbulbifer yueqingensis]SDK20461.1 hypothetical protein SAMN05216212_1802 [Microbulbifer yueqingensis]
MAEPLFQQLQQLQEEFRGYPPVGDWHPELCGDMDLVIRKDGSWVHEGTPIQRKPLVKLFASILRREGDDYFLVTPVEKWRIRVEDVPFLATQVARGTDQGEEKLLFTTSTGDIVPLDSDRAWELRPFGRPSQPVPYIEVRDGLFARVSRDVYYELVGWAASGEQGSADPNALYIESAGQRVLLGRY